MPIDATSGSRLPSFESLNDAAKWAARLCLSGQVVSPRGMETLEVFNAAFALLNPRARLLNIRGRRWNSALAVGELCWHVRGSNTLEPLTYYAPIWSEFSDDGRTIRGSCYGRKIFGRIGSLSQWEQARDFLLHDQDTRRAIITVGGYDPAIDKDTLDVACLQSLHFIIRDRKLDLICHMRSNDAYVGLPYDVFLFTMLHELMSIEVGVQLGTYYHLANSLHLYARDRERAEALLENPSTPGVMEPVSSRRGLEELLVVEANLRSGISYFPPKENPWSQLSEILSTFANKHPDRTATVA